MLHLPHKSSPRCWKCHACHDKRHRHQSATLPEKTLHLPHIPACNAESATPATTKDTGIKAPRFRRKRYTCHTFPPVMLKVLRLPRQKAAASKRHTSADIYAGTASATPATQIQPVMLNVPPATTKGSGVKAPHFRRHLLCRYSKCYTCHTNPARDAESARLPRQKASADLSIPAWTIWEGIWANLVLRRAHMKINIIFWLYWHVVFEPYIVLRNKNQCTNVNEFFRERTHPSTIRLIINHNSFAHVDHIMLVELAWAKTCPLTLVVQYRNFVRSVCLIFSPRYLCKLH